MKYGRAIEFHRSTWIFHIALFALPLLLAACPSPRADGLLDAHSADGRDAVTSGGRSGGGGRGGGGDWGSGGISGAAGEGAATGGDTGADDAAVPDTGQISPPDAAAFVDALEGELGHACSAAAQCQSGSCVDGVCCSTKCDGLCMACTRAFTGMSDGTCAPSRAGSSAHNDCVADAANPCGNDGTCNGGGACRKYAANKVCAAATCGANSAFTASSTCDGMGKCVAPAPISCAPYMCAAASGCVQTCTADAMCLGQSYCTAAGMCAAKKVDGAACTSNSAGKECLHGFCVDGVCCNSACTGTCMSCATPQAMGSCAPLAAGAADSACPKDTANVCGTDGACDGVGACRKGAKGLSCGPATCSGATLTRAPACDGSGTCSPGAASACGGALVCASTTACKTSCAANSECTAGSFCLGGQCLPKRAGGVGCDDGGQCSSNSCVEGVCCNTACGTTCHSCRAAKTGKAEGVCNTVTAGSSCGTNLVCSSTGACGPCTSGGSCSPTNPCKTGAMACGTGVVVCAESGNRPAGTSCGAAQSCRSGVKVTAAVCDSSGACPTPASTTCPFGCNAAGTDCELGPCEKNPQCTAGATMPCGSCGASRTCNSSCAWGACPAVTASCCPVAFEDHWVNTPAMPLHWQTVIGDPDIVDADDHLVLSYDDVMLRDALSGAYAATFNLKFNPAGTQIFLFDFGGSNVSQKYPAIRQVSGQLQLGGARYGSEVWVGFGAWSGTGTMFNATDMTVTVYVKSNAINARARIGGVSSDTGWITVAGLNPKTFQIANGNIFADHNGLVTLLPVTGCAGFTDADLDAFSKF